MSLRRWRRIFFIVIVSFFFSTHRGNAQGSGEVMGRSMTLPELLAELEARNPDLRAAAFERDAMQQRIRPAGALPDPVINFGQMNTGNIVPFTTLGETEMSRLSFGIAQEFPLFGKRDLRQKMAAKNAAAQTWQYESVRLELRSRLKVAYYELYLQYRVLESLQRNMALLQTFEETASSLYRVGKATQADVLRAQTELTRLQEQIELATQSKLVAEAEINSLLQRPAESLLPVPASVDTPTFDRDYDELLKLTMGRLPMLRQQQDVIASHQFAVELAEKERYPDLGVMFAYHNRGGLKDLWEMGGTVRIPLYFGRKQKYEIDAAASELAAAKKRDEGLRAAAQYSLKDVYSEATVFQRLRRLLEQTIIPQETLTLEATMASYQVGSADSLSVVSSLIQLTSDEIRYYEYLAKFQKALARMEPIVGEELTH
jgi:outer membrane protein, heavy metal efflux system